MSISLQDRPFVKMVEKPVWARTAVTQSLTDLDVRTCCASSIEASGAVLTGEYPPVVWWIFGLSWAEPDWIRPAEHAIQRLMELPAGWDSYGARPIEANAVDAILQVLGRTMERYSPAPAVVPTASGGLQLEWHAGGIDLEVEATPDGRVFMSCDGTACPAPQECEITHDPAPLAEVIATL